MPRIRPDRFEPGVQKPVPVLGMTPYQRFEDPVVAALQTCFPVTLEAVQQRDDAEFAAGQPHSEVNGAGFPA